MKLRIEPKFKKNQLFISHKEIDAFKNSEDIDIIYSGDFLMGSEVARSDGTSYLITHTD